MKILIISGNSLDNNSSTNLYKKRIFKELSKGNNLTVISSNNTKEDILYKLNDIEYIEYSLKSLRNRLIDYIISTFRVNNNNKIGYSTNKVDKETTTINMIGLLKKTYNFFKSSNRKLYGVYTDWVSKATKLINLNEYDLIISISHPAVSHKLAYELCDDYNGNIKWFQIWFEPWNLKKVNKYPQKIKSEKTKFLESGDHIFYMNPFTYNKTLEKYNDYANKVHLLDLPININQNVQKKKGKKKYLGYFGSYFTHNRNIIPLYEAVNDLNDFESYIIGNSNIKLKSKSNIIIKDRIPYNKLKKYEKNVSILVVISNYKKYSELIPGKIYEYSSTSKYILIILDGKEEHKKKMKEYFSKFNRYIYCNNNKESIKKTLRMIANGYYENDVINKPIEEFDVENVINQIIKHI